MGHRLLCGHHRGEKCARLQTPAIYLIERAVHWAQMPLEDWLQTVIRDDSVLTAVRDTLGLMESVENNT